MSLIASISGIRGTIGGKSGEGLTPPDVVKFTAAFGSWLKENHPQQRTVVIGRDARLSGEVVSRLVAATLQSLGLHVVDLGLSTTPTVELAVVAERAIGGIIVTASHNPVQWNALKLLNHEGEFISAEDGEEVLKLAEEQNTTFADVRQLGTYRTDDTYLQKHIDLILQLPLVDVKAIREKRYTVLVDGINSTGGLVVPTLLEALGVYGVVTLNGEPTGDFAHNPEPLPESLRDVSRLMERGNFDLGIAVDPDVDRLAFLSADGTPFGEEYTLVAIADYVLQHKKGNTVSNLSSTVALREVTERAGGKHYASAVGEVNVVAMMKAKKAVVGGEGNGGIIYPALHYGRDALVGIALFLSHLAKSGKNIALLRASYPSYHISKNKIELTANINVDEVFAKIQEKYKSNPVSTVDGVKIEFGKEWVHLRKSNTEPIIRIYSESDTLATADYLANKIISDIRELITR